MRTNFPLPGRQVRRACPCLLGVLVVSGVVSRPRAVRAADDGGDFAREQRAEELPPHVVVPGPHGSLLRLPDSETARGTVARMELLFDGAIDSAGRPLLRLFRADEDGVEVRLVVAADDLRAIGDADYELLLAAVHATLASEGAGVRRVRVEAIDEFGGSHREEELRPSIVARSTGVGVSPAPRAPAPFAETRPTGPLSGRRIALSPGHGWYWTGAGWETQRSETFGIVEDFLTAILCHYHVDPWLRAAGAEVIWMRERSFGAVGARIIDDGGVGYSETGSFLDGSTPGGWGDGYRYAWLGDGTSGASWSAGTWTDAVAVYTWYVPGSNRGATNEFILHSIGGDIAVPVDQGRGGPAWHFLGELALGEGGRIEAVARGRGDEVLVADAIRVGTSTGGVIRAGEPSGYPGWQESARNYAEWSGAPEEVWAARATERDSDVVARPLWANLLDVDAYVSVHTNAAGGTGTETFIHDTAPSPGSSLLQDRVHAQLLGDIRAWWNPAWTDRGEKSANFGEVREIESAPAVLIEVAFHDRDPATGPDVNSLRDPRFRRIVGRAIARGVARYFDAEAEFVPEAPGRVAVVNTTGGLEVRWQGAAESQGGGNATSWRVYVARAGRAFDAGTDAGGVASWRIPGVSAGDVVVVRVAGVNAGGEGPASPVVTARATGGVAAPLLMVQAFDRLDRSVQEADNTGDYLVEHAIALEPQTPAAGEVYAWDGATHAALVDWLDAEDWHTILWQAGEESTTDESFSNEEQAVLRAFAESGGRLLVSGSEVGWDLGRGGPDDVAFLNEVLRTTWVSDDANTYRVSATGEGPFSGLPAFDFSNGAGGVYDVDYADTFTGRNGGEVVLRYDSGGGAAIADLADRSVVHFGFPLESVVDIGVRGALLHLALAWLETPGVVVADAGGDDVDDVSPDADDPADAGGGGDGGPDADSGVDAPSDIAPSTDEAASDGAHEAAESGGDSADERSGGGELRDGNGGGDSSTMQVAVNDGCGCGSTGEPGSRWGLAPAVFLLLARRRSGRR